MGKKHKKNKEVNSNVEVKENTMNEEMKMEQTPAETEVKEGFFKRNGKKIGKVLLGAGTFVLGAVAGSVFERSRCEAPDPMDGVADQPETPEMEPELPEE